MAALELSSLPIELATSKLSDEDATYKGVKLTTSYVQSVLQSCDEGERDVYVDFLCECLEGDPHVSGILRSLYSDVANFDASVVPSANAGNARQQAVAEAIAEAAGSLISTHGWKRNIYGMLWAHTFGVSARELIWQKSGRNWSLAKFGYIHSRRINYVNAYQPTLVLSGLYNSELVFADYPAKFVVFEPVLSGDYPTREGIGRNIAYWLAFKRFASRELLGYVERFGKPFPIIHFATSDSGTPRPAETGEVTTAKTLVRDIGRGTQPGAVLPDSLQLTLANSSGEDAKTDTVHTKLIEVCNSEMNKAILASTLTSEVGDSGSRALGDVHERMREGLVKALCTQLDECITNQVVYWWTFLNFGETAATELCPRYVTQLNDTRDKTALAEQLATLVQLGLPVSVQDVRETFGWQEPIDETDLLGPSEQAAISNDTGEQTPVQE